MRKRVSIYFALLLAVTGTSGAICLAGQAPTPAAQTKEAAPPKSAAVYRLTFVVRELQGDKQLNSREFTASAEDGEWARVRVGNSVPLKSRQNKFTYQDVGINIDCHVMKREKGLLIDMRFDSSNFVAESGAEATELPLIRQFRFSGQSLLTLGKPAVVAKLDDVATNHRYEIEVTAARTPPATE